MRRRSPSRRRSSKPPAPPRKKQVVNIKSAPPPVNLALGSAASLTPKELESLSRELCMGRFTVAGNDGNLLLDTSKDSRVGMKYYVKVISPVEPMEELTLKYTFYKV